MSMKKAETERELAVRFWLGAIRTADSMKLKRILARTIAKLEYRANQSARRERRSDR